MRQSLALLGHEAAPVRDAWAAVLGCLAAAASTSKALSKVGYTQ